MDYKIQINEEQRQVIHKALVLLKERQNEESEYLIQMFKTLPEDNESGVLNGFTL